ncbi:MAG: hypothetical protein IKG14_06330 [Clostridia bacterium]|nr:hypothetical protein [Clostridia bacterium]
MIKNALVKISKTILILMILFTILGGIGVNEVQAKDNYRIAKVNDSGNFIEEIEEIREEGKNTIPAEIVKGKTMKFRLFDGTKSLPASTWTIANTLIAKITSINKNGIVTVSGINEGETSLKCSYAGKDHTIIIKVIDDGKTTYKIYPTTNSIKVGETKTYELRGNNKVIMANWIVSNPNVLKLEQTKGKAKIIGLKEGIATLKVMLNRKIKSKYNNKG